MKRTMWAVALAAALWTIPGCGGAQKIGNGVRSFVTWAFSSTDGEDSPATKGAKELTGILGPKGQWILLLTTALQNTFLGGKQIHKQVKKRKAKRQPAPIPA